MLTWCKHNRILSFPKLSLTWKYHIISVYPQIPIISKFSVNYQLWEFAVLSGLTRRNTTSFFPHRNITLIRARMWRPMSLFRLQGKLVKQRNIVRHNLKYSQKRMLRSVILIYFLFELSACSTVDEYCSIKRLCIFPFNGVIWRITESEALLLVLV
jgi:hypothetical protein